MWSCPLAIRPVPEAKSKVTPGPSSNTLRGGTVKLLVNEKFFVEADIAIKNDIYRSVAARAVCITVNNFIFGVRKGPSIR